MLILSSLNASAQTGQPVGRVYGPTDKDVPTPVHSLNTISDIAAIQAVINFVTKAGVVGWLGATAKGTIAFTGDSTTYPATVLMAAGDKARMDVQKTTGLESTIFSGSNGIFVSAAGTRSSISPDLVSIGLFGFVRLLAPGYPSGLSILSDQGTVSIRGRSLQRVTFDDPSLDGRGNPWKTADLYFDPSTKELVSSVVFAHLSSSDAALYTIETTYGDYTSSAGITLPRTISQSLNGQPQWTLSLSTFDLSALPSATSFTF